MILPYRGSPLRKGALANCLPNSPFVMSGAVSGSQLSSARSESRVSSICFSLIFIRSPYAYNTTIGMTLCPYHNHNGIFQVTNGYKAMLTIVFAKIFKCECITFENFVSMPHIQPTPLQCEFSFGIIVFDSHTRVVPLSNNMTASVAQPRKVAGSPPVAADQLQQGRGHWGAKNGLHCTPNVELRRLTQKGEPAQNGKP